MYLELFVCTHRAVVRCPCALASACVLEFVVEVVPPREHRPLRPPVRAPSLVCVPAGLGPTPACLCVQKNDN